MPDPPPPRQPRPAAGERVSRYHPRARRLCDACTFLIHQYGQAGAPYPKAARWRISTDTESRYVCNEHKDTRL